MVWSGLWIYWANDVYRIGSGSFTLFHFFPTRMYDLLSLGQKLAQGMAWHFTLMWFFALNGLAFFLYLLVSGEWRDFVHWGRAGKFNPIQRASYTVIVLMGGASLVTGLAIYKPVQLAWLTRLCGGYEAARWEHFWLTMGYCAFFLVHVTQVIRAGWNNFQAMITGEEWTEQ